MLGSQLLDRQPFFRGSDFGIPEIAVFSVCHFRRAVMTSDSWEEHDGTEILFMLSGEACWEFGNEQIAQVKGGQAIAFAPRSRHRILHGLYTPSRAIWIVFGSGQPSTRGGLIPPPELKMLLAAAAQMRTPRDLDNGTVRALNELAQRLGDDRIFLGSPAMKAEVRSRLYSALTGLWAQSGRRQTEPATAAVRTLASNLRHDLANNAPIQDFAKDLSYGHSQLYALFKREFGMSPNDYRHRLRIKTCCDLLANTNSSITQIAIDLGYSSSQYFCQVFKKYVGATPTEYRRMAATSLCAAE
jgi:AraC-like DNA-binding protein